MKMQFEFNYDDIKWLAIINYLNKKKPSQALY